MELRIKRASLRLKHLMLAVFLLLVLDILYLAVSRGTAHRQEFVLGAVGAAAVLLLLPPIFSALTRLGSLKLWLLLSLLCLTVKAVWVLLVQVPLAGITWYSGTTQTPWRAGKSSGAAAIWPCFHISSATPIF